MNLRLAIARAGERDGTGRICRVDGEEQQLLFCAERKFSLPDGSSFSRAR